MMKPICLSTHPLRLSNREAFLAGWGDTASTSNGWLHFVKLKILPFRFCPRYNDEPSYGDYFTKDDILCTESRGKNPCPGDSGSALVIWDKRRKRFLEVGVASFTNTFNCANKTDPVVFTLVYKFVPWIREVHIDSHFGEGHPIPRTAGGGSLISETFVLTAAHVIKDNVSLAPKVLLRPKATYIFKAFAEEAAELIPHPRYNVSTTENDIALIRGDSGSGLVIWDKRRKRFLEVGVQSFTNTKICINKTEPDVFMRVSTFVPWIRQVMAEETSELEENMK
ncbi:hypothetical protein MTO96_030060 [Rhipicephalus appendiculatus]